MSLVGPFGLPCAFLILVDDAWDGENPSRMLSERLGCCVGGAYPSGWFQAVRGGLQASLWP